MNLKRHHVLYGILAVSLIIALLVLLVPSAPRLSFTPSLGSSSTSQEGETAQDALPQMRFEVVTTQSEQERGLGGRAEIPENYGMLFVFPQPQRVGFWMKDMLAPIDIIWLSDEGSILGIEDSVSPDTYPEAFYPPQPVKYVLETKAGEARRRGWSEGTRVLIPVP